MPHRLTSLQPQQHPLVSQEPRRPLFQLHCGPFFWSLATVAWASRGLHCGNLEKNMTLIVQEPTFKSSSH